MIEWEFWLFCGYPYLPHFLPEAASDTSTDRAPGWPTGPQERGIPGYVSVWAGTAI